MARYALAITMALVQGGNTLAQSDVVSRSLQPPVLDDVLVTGEYPGPALWKVSKGDHVILILGTIGYLSKGVQWKSSMTESAIASSQEVLLDVVPNESINPFVATRLALRQRRTELNPTDAKLKDTLPGDLYARFSAFKQQYAPKDDRIEKLRPYVAGQYLSGRAVDHAWSELEQGLSIEQEVRKIAKRHGVRAHRIEYEVQPDNRSIPKIEKYLATMSSRSIETEIECLSHDLDRFEESVKLYHQEVAAQRTTIAAWARGDIHTLRTRTRVVYPPRPPDGCTDASAESNARARGNAYRAVRESAWTDGVLAALSRNKVTFAIYPIDWLLDANGPLLLFAERGYAIEEN